MAVQLELVEDTGTNQMEDPLWIQKFVFAGNAILTLVSKKTGVRFTYRVNKAARDRDFYFVSLLVGPDNTRNFKYFGFYRTRSVEFEHGMKAKISVGTPSARAWRYFSRHVIQRSRQPEDYDLEVWHQGRCGKCGRTLTVPQSIARGIGPECWENLR